MLCALGMEAAVLVLTPPSPCHVRGQPAVLCPPPLLLDCSRVAVLLVVPSFRVGQVPPLGILVLVPTIVIRH